METIWVHNLVLRTMARFLHDPDQKQFNRYKTNE
jgi:hypothetical protein